MFIVISTFVFIPRVKKMQHRKTPSFRIKWPWMYNIYPDFIPHLLVDFGQVIQYL